MAKQLWKPGTLAAPIPPMLVSCGTLESPNILTAAWCGNINSTPPRVYVSIRPERYSYHLIRDSGEFVLNLTTEKLLRAADWCGVRSGRDYKKFDETGLTPEPCTELAAPQIAECPLTLECRVFDVVPLGSHDMFLADVVAVHVDDSLLDSTGSLHIERAGLAAYAHGQYFALGKSLGHFGFSVKKKSTQKRQAAARGGRPAGSPAGSSAGRSDPDAPAPRVNDALPRPGQPARGAQAPRAHGAPARTGRPAGSSAGRPAASGTAPDRSAAAEGGTSKLGGRWEKHAPDAQQKPSGTARSVRGGAGGRPAQSSRPDRGARRPAAKKRSGR